MAREGRQGDGQVGIWHSGRLHTPGGRISVGGAFRAQKWRQQQGGRCSARLCAGNLQQARRAGEGAPAMQEAGRQCGRAGWQGKAANCCCRCWSRVPAGPTCWGAGAPT